MFCFGLEATVLFFLAHSLKDSLCSEKSLSMPSPGRGFCLGLRMDGNENIATATVATLPIHSNNTTLVNALFDSLCVVLTL